MGTVEPMSDKGENGAGTGPRRPRVIQEQSQNLQASMEAPGTFLLTPHERTNVSNPYLSQIERGLHEPSVRFLRSIARALNLSAETLLAQAGVLEGEESQDSDRPRVTTEDAIRADPYLSQSQKEALLSVYRSYRSASASS